MYSIISRIILNEKRTMTIRFINCALDILIVTIDKFQFHSITHLRILNFSSGLEIEWAITLQIPRVLKVVPKQKKIYIYMENAIEITIEIKLK